MLVVGACGVVEMASVLEGLLIRTDAIGVGGILIAIALLPVKVAVTCLVERG